MWEDLQTRAISWLRWSETYTKTDMVYLFRGGSFTLLNQVFSSGIAFALLLVFGRLVPKDVYGNYKYILSIVALISTLSLGGISTAVFQSVSRGFDGALSQGFWINLRWSVLMFAGALAGGAYYAFNGNTALAVGILFGGCLSPLISSASLYAQFLVAKKDFYRFAFYTGLWSNAIPAVALASTVFLTHNLLLLIVVYFASNTLSDLFFYYCTKRLYHPDDSKKDPEMLTYSQHLSAITILGSIATNIDQVLLFHFGGALQLAVYSFATNPLNQYKGPAKMFDSMVQRQFSNRPAREVRASMANKMLWLALASVLVIVLYLPLAPILYKLFFPAYIDAVPYSQVFSLILLSVIGTPAGSYLTAKKHVRELYIDGIGSYAVQIGLMVVGVVWWGLWGLVIARVLARIADATILFVLYELASRRDMRAEQLSAAANLG